MRKFALALLLTGLTARLFAAESDWLTDFDAAKAKAKEDKKLLFMDFTGSDWCPPCKALHANVLKSKEFAEFAKDNLILLVVDFPRTKKLSPQLTEANKKLSEKFAIEGFPTVIVMDGAGKELSKDVGYSGASAKEYVGKLKKLVK